MGHKDASIEKTLKYTICRLNANKGLPKRQKEEVAPIHLFNIKRSGE
jgi:hypothetical protein